MEMNIAEGTTLWRMAVETEAREWPVVCLAFENDDFSLQGLEPVGRCLLRGWTVGLISQSLILGFMACESVRM